MAWFIFLFGQILWICCLSFFNAFMLWIDCSISLSKHSTNKIPSLPKHCCHVLSATTGPVSIVFSLLLKQQTHRLWHPHHIHVSDICESIGLDSSAVRNSVTTLCLVRVSTISASLHRYCVERTWLTGALMIWVELESAAVWWVRQDTLSRTTFKRKNRRCYFHTDIHVRARERTHTQKRS